MAKPIGASAVPADDPSALSARTSNGGLPEGIGFRDACHRLSRRADLRRLWWVALGALLASKIGALLPGMAPDDYFFAFHGAPASITDQFIAQGRALDVPLAQFVDQAGTSFLSIAWFSFALAMVTIAAAIAVSITVLKRDRRNRPHHYLAAAFIAVHPYLTAYFLFKMSILNTAIVYGVLAGLLLMYVYARRPWQRVWCAVLVALSCYISQIVLVLFVVAAGAWAVLRWCEKAEAGDGWRDAVRPVVAFAATVLGAAVLYLASGAAVRHIAHVESLATYTPHLVGGVAGVVRNELRLAGEVLLQRETVYPLWTKHWILISLIVLIAGCAWGHARRAAACVALLLGGLLVTVSPMAFSWGKLVPRTFSPAGLCLGLALCIACDGVRWRSLRALAGALWLPLTAFAMVGSTLFYQQLLLTKWDQQTAASIYQRAIREGGSAAALQIVAAWPVHRQPLSMAGSGINKSAFYYRWSYPGLFAVATGNDVKVSAGPTSLCAGTPSWPAQASVHRVAKGVVVACIGNVAR